MTRFPYRFKEVNFIQPVSQTAAQGGNYNFVSMRNAQYASVNIRTGVLTSTAPAVTMQQAKNVEGDGSKALAIPTVWINIPASSPQDEADLWIENTVTSDTFNLASNTNYRIDYDASQLDASNNFDCIRPSIAAPGTSILISVTVLLYGLRYTGKGKSNQPSATVNRMPNRA